MLEISVCVHQDIRSMLIAALKRREEKALFPLLTPTVLGWLGWALTTGKKGKEEESRANPRRTKKEEALIPTTPLTLLPGCFWGRRIPDRTQSDCVAAYMVRDSTILTIVKCEVKVSLRNLKSAFKKIFFVQMANCAPF